MSRILILGDTHHPWADKEAIEMAASLASKMKPDYIVQIGDLYDLYCWSQFKKNPNFIKPQEEEERGREDAEAMWLMMKDAAPKAKLIQLYGNHDLRPVKHFEGKDAAAHVLKRHVKTLMTFDGVSLVNDEHEIDGIMFLHGFRRPGEHARYNQQNTIVGHSHRPGVYYDQNKTGVFWELNVGCMIDAESEAFSYKDQQKIHKMIVGVGMVDDYGPRFVEL